MGGPSGSIPRSAGPRRIIPTCNKKHPPNKKRPPRQQTSPATKNILRHKIDQTISRGVFLIGGVSRTPPLIKSFEKDPLVSILPLLCIFLSSSLPLSLSSSQSLTPLLYIYPLSPIYVSLSSFSLLFPFSLSFSQTYAKCRPSKSTQFIIINLIICCRFR